jgi:lipopolysaccharide export system permease protein
MRYRFDEHRMLFDTSLRRELARTFGATLVVILTIVLTMMLIKAIGQAAAGAVSPQDIVLLLGYTGLGHLATMLALSLCVAVVVTLGRMYRDSEMAVWHASGVGLGRFVKPVLRMAWPVLAIIVVLMLVVWPWGNRQGLELRERYQQRSDISRVAPGVFQTSRDGSRVFFVERDVADTSAAGGARNVFVLTQRDDREAVIAARRGRLETRGDERWLVLEDGRRNEIDAASGDKSVAAFDRYEILASEKSVQRAENEAPKLKSTLRLLAEPNPSHQGELTWRFGLALGAGNLLLLAIGLASRNPRRPSNWNLAFALLAFVVYYNFINLSQVWVARERLGMGTALLAVHGVAFVLALGLIGWRDRAAVIGVRIRRAPRVAQAA